MTASLRQINLASAILLASLALVTCADAAAEYSRRIEIPPLRISFGELQPVLDKAAELSRLATKNPTAEPRPATISLGGGSVLVEIEGNQLPNHMARLPKHIDRFNYVFTAADPDAPVSRIDIDLRDYDRTLTVNGSSQEQVDATAAALREALEEISTPIGGTLPRGILSGVAAMMSALALMLLIFVIQSRGAAFKTPLLLAICSVAVLIIVLRSDVLNGFLLVSGDASFTVRYGNAIALAGLVLAISGSPISWILEIRRQNEQKAEESDGLTASYLEWHERLVKAIASKKDLKIVKKEHGSVYASGDALFDAIFERGSIRIGCTTFRPDTRRHQILVFVANAAKELVDEHVQQVVIILFKGENDDYLRKAAKGLVALFRRDLAACFSVQVLDTTNIDLEASALDFTRLRS